MRLLRSYRPSRRRAGLTLLELLISGALLAIVLGSVGMISMRGMRLFEVSSANNEINARAGRSIDRITREFLGARRTDVVAVLTTPAGAPTVWTTTLDFPTALDWVGGNVAWSSNRRVALELAPGEVNNGLDDNNNGLVDEGRVVLTVNVGQADEASTVLVNGVREFLEGETFNGVDDNGNGLVDEPGFCFSLEEGALRVRLSLEKNRGAEGLLTRTLEDSLTLRN